jgi:hypothetical protein
MRNEADNNNNNDNTQQQPMIKDNKSDLQEELSEPPLSPTQVIIDDEPAPAAGIPTYNLGDPQYLMTGGEGATRTLQGSQRKRGGRCWRKSGGQVHAEHDDDDDKHAKDDGRADPHDRGPVGDARRDRSDTRRACSIAQRLQTDIYDYYPKRNYELHESIPTEEGKYPVEAYRGERTRTLTLMICQAEKNMTLKGRKR